MTTYRLAFFNKEGVVLGDRIGTEERMRRILEEPIHNDKAEKAVLEQWNEDKLTYDHLHSFLPYTHDNLRWWSISIG